MHRYNNIYCAHETNANENHSHLGSKGLPYAVRMHSTVWADSGVTT
jgi:hypothetical protein